MEGLHVATPLFDPYVVPVAIVILVGLFVFQSKGTTGVGRVFGPVTFLWFARLAILGIHQIGRAPAVLGSDKSAARGLSFSCERWQRVRGSGRGFSRRHRWRSALRGHRSLRHRADSDHVVRGRAAGVDPELLRTGALLARSNPTRPSNPFYNMAPSLGALSDGGARHRGCRHRIAGDHQRRIFSHDAGDPARLHPAPARALHFRSGSSARSTCRW